MGYAVITFYKYVQITDTISLLNQLKVYCKEHNLKGRILISTEGINGGVSGTAEAVTAFKKYIRQNTLFTELTFREQPTQEIAYHNVVVRVRREVVDFGQPVNLGCVGKRIAPKVLKQWLDNKEDLVLLDARNEYETKVGRFKNAYTLPIETFRDFAQAAQQLFAVKEKKIVMYCTGGIRCEKSSAFLKQQGFKDVYQLEGGIINFTNQFPNTYFEGSCFVFDDRIVAPVGSKEPINACSFCPAKSDDYINCHNLDCDKLFIACASCQRKMAGTCSQECSIAPRQRDETIQQKNVRHHHDMRHH